jgi:hypothetical protein
MASSVPKAVPSSVAASTSNSVDILTEPQLGPYRPMTGSSIVPVVPRTDTGNPADINPQPKYGHAIDVGGQFEGGSAGAPSLPTDGYLFKKGPIDPHYVSQAEVRNPYAKVNNPPTRGMFTWVKEYLNHIAQSPQNVDPNGFRNSPPQQRTSVMRITPPNHGAGYAPETFTPRQLPQSDNTYKYNPAIGTQAYGTGVLNSDTFGAGQTAGGIGGNQYTPTIGPPVTTSTADAPPVAYSMPVWG